MLSVIIFFILYISTKGHLTSTEIENLITTSLIVPLIIGIPQVIYHHYQDKYFVYINTSKGIQSIFSSTDYSKADKIVQTILDIKNGQYDNYNSSKSKPASSNLYSQKY